MLNYRNLTKQELEAWVRSQGLPAFRGRQLFRWLWRPGFKDFAQATDFSLGLREDFAARGEIRTMEPVEALCSADGTRKFAWRLVDGEIIETVLIPERGHTTLCVSTQAGCAMGCRFCNTARMGFRRDLEPYEIAGQALRVMEETEESLWPRNIVFMGMGEPLANYASLLAALDILTDDHGLNFSLRRITVSTCGLVPSMLKLGKDTDVGLAVSLHGPDDETRDRIMPVNRRWNVQALIEACRQYPVARRRRITFEYLLLHGINDSDEHARRLGKLLRGIPSKINLIPFNETEDIPFRRSSAERMEAFQNILRNMNYTVMMRKSKGQDIAAACGQLYAEKNASPSNGRNEVQAGPSYHLSRDP